MPDIRKPQPPSRPQSIAAGTKPGAVQQWAVWAEEVERLLEQGKSKPAVELAKVAHKHTASAASEALLVKAYAARIHALVQAGLNEEAKALLALVGQRYSRFKEALAGIGFILHAGTSLDDFLRPFADPDLPQDKRAEIETVIRRKLTDLAPLAQSAVLPATHPLRLAATKLEQAFRAVTTGPVSDDALSLTEISHQSPLAPWKSLVRAIASFYRGDDRACERWLEQVAADSAPARLVPALSVMLAKPSKQPLKPAAIRLTTQIVGEASSVRASLEALDRAFVAGKPKRIARHIEKAVADVKTSCPDLVERLKQHIAVRAYVSDRRALAAIPDGYRKDAHFWHLLARLTEVLERDFTLEACSLWEQFRKHAVAQGLFAEDGPEIAALYLHMAEILEQSSPEELARERPAFEDRFPGYLNYYSDQPADIRRAGARQDPEACYFLRPELLYARACAIDPDPETFRQWLHWARRSEDWHLSDRAAQSWRRALPKDGRPLLHLMESAEKRGALKKALGYLEEAEALDRLNPEVRRARLRLLTANAVRHLSQNKVHLVELDAAALEALPQAGEVNRPAFLAALRWASGVLDNNRQEALHYSAQLAALLESRAAATVTLANLADMAGFRSAANGFLGSDISGEKIAEAVACACALGEDLGLKFVVPSEWDEKILDELRERRLEMGTRQLCLLAEAALRAGRRELAFAACGAGLAKGGPTEARFLLLRGQALPEWEFSRRDECFIAAAELARRQRDMDLAEEAVEFLRTYSRQGSTFLRWAAHREPRSFSMSSEEVQKILERERKASKLPVLSPDKPAPDYGSGRWNEEIEEEHEEEEDDSFAAMNFEELTQFLFELAKRIVGPRDPDGTPGKRHRPSSRGQRSLF
ncbi:MAG: hypothetical protein DMG38_28505 [Acidobacteria bacterium]|nr:MAG: hypothetical protein DMG38_28505 [Acidobacteriota bacterium]